MQKKNATTLNCTYIFIYTYNIYLTDVLFHLISVFFFSFGDYRLSFDTFVLAIVVATSTAAVSAAPAIEY